MAGVKDRLDLGVICGVRDKREAGSSPNCRTHLDLMLQEFRSAVHDKQAESQSIRTRRFEAMKGLKDIFQLLRCHADPGIVNLEANARTVATASQKNLPALFSEFHGVAREVADDAS
jgi:hypothetical protein